LAYKEQVREQLRDVGESSSETTALWDDIAESFEADGAEGVRSSLEERMSKLREEFDTALESLNDTL